MTERISQPLRTPTPRKERTEVRFALSYEALKMKSISSAAQISAIFFAIRQTNFSDSITHGPRMNTGSLPPMTTLPTRNGFIFSLIFIQHVIPSREDGEGPRNRAKHYANKPVLPITNCEVPRSARND